MGWLTKLTLTLAVLGLLAFDGLSIATARLAVADQAVATARTASTSFQRTHDVQEAYGSAVTAAAESNPGNDVPPETFVAAPDGTVSLTVERTAPTLVVSRIGWIRDWAEVTGSGTGKDVS